MRRWRRGILAATCVLAFGAALCAQDAVPPAQPAPNADEQKLWDDLVRAAQTRPTAATPDPDAIQKAVIAHVEGLHAKCEDYRKRFPTGAHDTDVRLMQAQVMIFLGTQSPEHRKLLDGVSGLVQPVIDADPKSEKAAQARVALVGCAVTRGALAATREEKAPAQAEAIRQSETILREHPQSPMIPEVLDFLAGAYDRAGRDADAAAARDRIVKGFPLHPIVKKVERDVAQRALKGTVVEFAFTSTTGESIDLKNYRGRVVLVDFWASWCGPCKRSMPVLVEVEKKFRDQGFRVVGVSLDQDKAPMEAFMREQGMTWPQRFDGLVWRSPVAGTFFLTGIPTTFLIDKTGRLRAFNVDGHELAAVVRQLLDEPAPK